MFFFSCRSYKTVFLQTRIRYLERIRGENIVIVAAEAVVVMVVNASGVARFVVVATTLPLSVTKFDVTSEIGRAHV